MWDEVDVESLLSSAVVSKIISFMVKLEKIGTRCGRQLVGFIWNKKLRRLRFICFIIISFQLLYVHFQV